MLRAWIPGRSARPRASCITLLPPRSVMTPRELTSSTTVANSPVRSSRWRSERLFQGPAAAVAVLTGLTPLRRPGPGVPASA